MPTIQSLRVLEGAASIALLIAPELAKKYLKELGIKSVETETAKETPIDIHTLANNLRNL